MIFREDVKRNEDYYLLLILHSIRGIFIIYDIEENLCASYFLRHVARNTLRSITRV